SDFDEHLRVTWWERKECSWRTTDEVSAVDNGNWTRREDFDFETRRFEVKRSALREQRGARSMAAAHAMRLNALPASRADLLSATKGRRSTPCDFSAAQ